MANKAAIETICGTVVIEWRCRGRICAIHLPGRSDGVGDAPPDWLRPLAAAIQGYFAGESTGFPDIELDWGKQTPFRQKVYEYISKLTAGETLSYGEVAAHVGSPGAARAVGQAMANNPFPIIIPCHRITAAHGLGGFAGNAPGMVDLKRYMLGLEGLNEV